MNLAPGAAALLLLLVPLEAGTASSPSPSFLGDFSVTYYWVAVEDEAMAAAPDQLLRDAAGEEIARVSSAFRRALDREGTGRLRDGRLVNVDRRAGGEWRYTVLEKGWGRGAWGAELSPFRSVACDPGQLSAGSRLFLPALAGLPLPDGSRHDGIVVVDDTGSALRGHHLDVFIASIDYLPLFERSVPSRSSTPVYVADDCE